jgi:diacylglycerol kinase family enzyme
MTTDNTAVAGPANSILAEIRLAARQARLVHPRNAVRRVTVILNEAAASVKAGMASEIASSFTRAGIGISLESVGGDTPLATIAARGAARGDVLVAAGGDGTVSAVAAVAVDTNSTFGVIPLGTLNHFARDAGIPLDREQAIAAIADGRVNELDVADLNGRVFVNNASLGLYPRILFERNSEQRRGRRKWTAVAVASFRVWRRYRLLTVRITVDGHDAMHRTPFVLVGNGAYQSVGLGLGRRLSLHGGQLSVYVAPECGRFEFVGLPLRALVHRLPQDKFEAFLGRTVTIEPAHPRVSVALDGEVGMIESPLRYRSRAAALRMIVGRGS